MPIKIASGGAKNEKKTEAKPRFFIRLRRQHERFLGKKPRLRCVFEKNTSKELLRTKKRWLSEKKRNSTCQLLTKMKKNLATRVFFRLRTFREKKTRLLTNHTLPRRQKKTPRIIFKSYYLCLIFFCLQNKTHLSLAMSTQLKVCVVGDEEVGKTTLVCRFIQGVFVKHIDIINDVHCDVLRKLIEVGGGEGEGEGGGGKGREVVMLEILDMPRLQEDFLVMREIWVRDSDCFLVLYSVGDYESFEKVKEWLELIYKIKDTGDVAIVVVGHKSDLGEGEGEGEEGEGEREGKGREKREERKVLKHEGEGYVGLHEGLLFMEVSSKSGENVERAFEEVVMRYREVNRKGRGKKEEKGELSSSPPVVYEVQKGRTVKGAKR